MKNADGTQGPHWSLEQAKDILVRHGLKLVPHQFWAGMNAAYSDLCAFFKKYNLDTDDTYLDFTRVFWFRDEDAAVVDKLKAYYEAVVNQESENPLTEN